MKECLKDKSKVKMRNFTDKEILRNSIAQVLELDLSESSGWKEGTVYHLGPPSYKPNLSAGENLVKRGILKRDGGRLILTESALIRIMNMAMDSVVEDLLKNDPPPASLPKFKDYDGIGPQKLIFTGLVRDELSVR